MWGWYGFQKMPKRKDPSIPVRVAVASTNWPGASAEQVEQLVTRPIEQTMAQNAFVKPPVTFRFRHPLDQLSRPFIGVRAAGR